MSTLNADAPRVKGELKPRFNATELRRTADGHFEVVGPVWVDVDEEPDHRSPEEIRRSLQRFRAKYGPPPRESTVRAPRPVAARASRAPRRQRGTREARAGDADGEPAPSPLERRLQRAKQTRDRERAALNLWRRNLREQTEDPRKDLETSWLLKRRAKHWHRSLPALEAVRFKSRAGRPLAYFLAACLAFGHRALVGSARELALLAGVDRATVFRALAELEAAGWIVRLPRYRPGKGGRRLWRTASAYAPGPALLAAWKAATEVQSHGATASQKRHNARKREYDREVGAFRDHEGQKGGDFSGALRRTVPAGIFAGADAAEVKAALAAAFGARRRGAR